MANRVRHFLPALLCIPLLLAGTAIGGLSERMKKALSERFREGQLEKVIRSWYMTRPGTFLVVRRPGLPWNSDFGQAFNLAPIPAQVDIRGGIVVKRGRYENLLKPGSILGIWRLKFKKNRVELVCRTLSPYPVLISRNPRRATTDHPGINEEFVTTRLRFFFESRDLQADRADPLIKAISDWVQPFDDLHEAIEFSRTIEPKPNFDVLVGMTGADVKTVLGTPRSFSRPNNRGLYVWNFTTHEITFRKDRVVAYHRFKISSSPHR